MWFGLFGEAHSEREYIQPRRIVTFIYLSTPWMEWLLLLLPDDVMMTTVIEGEASPRRCDVEITRTTYLFERLNDLLLSAWYEMSSQLRLHDQQTTPTATSDHKADSKVSEWLTQTALTPPLALARGGQWNDETRCRVVKQRHDKLAIQSRRVSQVLHTNPISTHNHLIHGWMDGRRRSIEMVTSLSPQELKIIPGSSIQRRRRIPFLSQSNSRDRLLCRKWFIKSSLGNRSASTPSPFG